MNKLYLIGMVCLLSIATVASLPAASASGGWDCHGDPDVAQACTAKELWWPSDCFLQTSILGHNQIYCY